MFSDINEVKLEINNRNKISIITQILITHFYVICKSYKESQKM